MTFNSWTARLHRAGAVSRRDIQLDYLWLLGVGLALIATGIGLRDPWPADEPRFALIARDMVATGQWLVPHVGGEVYADKPPLFFWLMALFIAVTGSLRAAFLLPSLFAALGSVLLVYDLARRLWNRETGLIAGLCLLLTVQFVWHARQAQIDATLCFWTTLSLYGLLRHLLLGPQWSWYAIGWAAAGLGAITKGVGFLPLLVLIPFVILRAPQWAPKLRADWSARWLLGPLAFVLAMSIWLVPILLAAQNDPTLAAYRDEILLRQTVGRYTDAWHHREPVWYFVFEVIPWLWLPLTALVPWLVPRWRAAWRERDLRIALPLCWVVLVVLFFSLSTGKRGVYVLPAVPAVALICAPYIADLASHRAAQRMLFAVTAIVGAICTLAIGYVLIRPHEREQLLTAYALDPLRPLTAIAVLLWLACALARPRRGFTAFGAALAVVLLIVSYWVNPTMNHARSGAAFVTVVERAADPRAQLGLVAFKEQYLLKMTRPVVHFGHARWREAKQEAADAAAWLAAAPNRQLLVGNQARAECFAQAPAKRLGFTNRVEWFIVRGQPDPACVARGRLGAAKNYEPP